MNKEMERGRARAAWRLLFCGVSFLCFAGLTPACADPFEGGLSGAEEHLSREFQDVKKSMAERSLEERLSRKYGVGVQVESTQGRGGVSFYFKVSRNDTKEILKEFQQKVSLGQDVQDVIGPVEKQLKEVLEQNKFIVRGYSEFMMVVYPGIEGKEGRLAQQGIIYHDEWIMEQRGFELTKAKEGEKFVNFDYKTEAVHLLPGERSDVRIRVYDKGQEAPQEAVFRNGRLEQ